MKTIRALAVASAAALAVLAAGCVSRAPGGGDAGQAARRAAQVPTSATANPALAAFPPSTTPDPPRYDRALTLRVRTVGPVSKVRVKLLGAEGSSRADYFLKRVGRDTWAAAFIAPAPGTYPIEVYLYDANGTAWRVENRAWKLRTTGRVSERPDQLVRDYLRALPHDYAKAIKSVEILSVEELSPSEDPSLPEGARLFRAVIEEQRWQGPPERKIYVFTLRPVGTDSGYYISDVRASR